MSTDPTLDRLDDQISWCDQKTRRSQFAFKTLKTLVIATAAANPLLSGLHVSPWATGFLGALIAVVEATQQLNQYQHNWITFRTTCEFLKHEKYPYLAHAGPCEKLPNGHSLLAEKG